MFSSKSKPANERKIRDLLHFYTFLKQKHTHTRAHMNIHTNKQTDAWLYTWLFMMTCIRLKFELFIDGYKMACFDGYRMTHITVAKMTHITFYENRFSKR